MFLAVRNKEIMCACCIYIVNWNMIGTFDAFQLKKSENGRKNIFRDKQTTKKTPLMFLDVKKVTEK